MFISPSTFRSSNRLPLKTQVRFSASSSGTSFAELQRIQMQIEKDNKIRMEQAKKEEAMRKKEKEERDRKAMPPPPKPSRPSVIDKKKR